MATIEMRTFGGMMPSANQKLMPASASVLARNLELRYSDFRPLPQPSNMGAAAAGATLYRFSGSPAFITNPNPVNYVRGPIPNDPLERTYYTGDGAPKVIDNAGGIRPLGVPAPATAPLAEITNRGSYTSIDSQVDQAAKQAEILAIVQANCTKPYEGISDADLGPNFVHLSDTPEWAGTLKIPGTMTNGNFVPTNLKHLNLMDDRLGFNLATYGGATIGRVDLEVRGQRVAFDYAAMQAALLSIVDPSDPSGTKKLLTLNQVTQLQQAIRDAISSADTAYASDVARLHELLFRFNAISSTGSPSATGTTVAMQAFYATLNVAYKMSRALAQATSAVFSAMNTYNKAP